MFSGRHGSLDSGWVFSRCPHDGQGAAVIGRERLRARAAVGSFGDAHGTQVLKLDVLGGSEARLVPLYHQPGVLWDIYYVRKIS